MKNRRRVFAVLLVCALTAPSVSHAADDAGDVRLQQLNDQLKQLREQMEAMQQQMKQLQSQAPANALEPSPTADAPADPFSFADFGWLNGNSRQKDFPLDGKIFSGQLSVDANYTYSFAQPKDHSIVGSTTSGRTNEIQLLDLGVGGDFHWNNVRGRFMTQLGLYSTMTPRNDASIGRGQWDLSDAYRYISEAYGGYHFNALHGINLDVGIFLSYVGLCSYYDYENWVYQASYVSANTPWFFNGARLQIFPTDRFKVEFWFVNGWQSYGMFNEMPGLGLQFLWRPTEWFSLVSNEYVGEDTLNNAKRLRMHDDTSVQFKYFDRPKGWLSKAAFSLTVDAGCENGGGVQCAGGNAATPSQYFVGFMLYNRLWFLHDLFGLTLGGGAISNPGRYLVLMPAINGATALSGTPYFTTNPGQQFLAWDCTTTVDYMLSQSITFRGEFVHRWASVPYFSGPGGITPNGGNQGPAGSAVAGFTPDLRHDENRFQLVVMVRI